MVILMVDVDLGLELEQLADLLSEGLRARDEGLEDLHRIFVFLQVDLHHLCRRLLRTLHLEKGLNPEEGQKIRFEVLQLAEHVVRVDVFLEVKHLVQQQHR